MSNDYAKAAKIAGVAASFSIPGFGYLVELQSLQKMPLKN